MKNQIKKKSFHNPQLKQSIKVLSPSRTLNSYQKISSSKQIRSPKHNNKIGEFANGKIKTDRNEKKSKEDQRKAVDDEVRMMDLGIEMQRFVSLIKEQDFEDTKKIRIHIFDFVIQKRVVKDADFERIYELLSAEFEKFDRQIKQILGEVLAALDE